FCEGAARQEKRVNGTVGDGVVTGDSACVIDAPAFGKTDGIVRVNDGIAKATIAEPDKTAHYPSRINELANDVASFINLLGQGVISVPGIIKSRDHFDRARGRCPLTERCHQWQHE